MKRTSIALLASLFLSVPCAADAAPSDLEGRYAIGLGWGYLRGFGSFRIAGTDDNLAIESGSIWDSPRIITTKFGLASRLALEPSVTIYYSDQSEARKSNGQTSSTEDESMALIRLSPVLAFALFQKETVNFYLKGGLSLFYNGNWRKYDYGPEIPADEISSDSRIWGLGLPVGFGIEWWMTEHLAFDISTMSDLLSYYDGKAKVEGEVTEDFSNFSASLGNFLATLSLMFWF